MTEEEWRAISERDASCDGKFFCAVKTTGVVCRPSCPSKICNPENAVIFYSLEEALENGYRPCRKCRPGQADWKGAKRDLAEKARQLIEERCMQHVSVRELSEELFVSEEHLLRTFRAVYGCTPHWYFNKCRCDRAAALLMDSALSVTEIAGMAGFSTPSHFTNVFQKMEGMTPTEYRKKAGTVP